MQVLPIKSQTGVRATLNKPRLRFGFVPLTDCAPLVVAQEMGWFRRAGLNVVLTRELGWATVRDKLLFGQLDAAHALAPMVFLLSLGLAGTLCPCFTPLVLNLQGNAITLSQPLWQAGVRDAAGLRAWQQETGKRERLTFGIVFPSSFHHFLLRDWLAAGGLSVERDVRLVVVPPPQMVVNLKAGHLDGFCAGEPWNSWSEEVGAGHCVARSADLEPLHPEKVLLIREAAWAEHPEEFLAAAAVILSACEYCANPANAQTIAELLAHSHCVGVSPSALLASLGGVGASSGSTVRNTLFYGPEVNAPTADKAALLLTHLRRAGLLQHVPNPSRLGALFRADLFQSIGQTHAHTHYEKTTRTETEPKLV